jgi:hypothetical protein
MTFMALAKSPHSELEIPAEKRGFCRRMALSSVEPDRGKPDMK